MRVVVGLGNPGKKYESTRHNLGFRVVDQLAGMTGAGDWELKFEGLLARGGTGDDRFYLMKPQTFMNNSGRSVAALRQFYKIDLSDILIIVDDLDLDVGKVRMRESGSDGGHRGLRSVIATCGDPGFKRIRIGVGRPVVGRGVIAHVLGKFGNKDSDKKITAAVEIAADKARAFIDRNEFENWSTP